MEKIIKHYGTPRHSGRYPWGSGDNAQQHSTSLLGYVDEMKAKGLSETDIAAGLGMKTTQLRRLKSLAKAEKRAADSAMVLRLKDKGMSNIAIGKRMGINESSVRSLLDPALKERSQITANTANMLKSHVGEKGIIDVGAGVEAGLGISRTKLNTAVEALKQDGYEVYYIKTQQLGTGKYTSIKVLAPPGTPYSDVAKNKANIQTITDYSFDGGRSFLGLEPIQSVNGSRVLIQYKEDGGGDKDGVIELKRGVDDLSLGKSKYAQVRIGVDGTHYLKGMAIYSDDLPPGIDIIYNTSKHNDVPREEVFKTMKDDPDNPFGATIKRGGQLGALNIVNEEGDWTEWSKNISSQVLSKQSPVLAKKQLELDLALKQEEFDEISSLTNPVLKKQLLMEFAEGADSSAVHLKAAALPRQANHVLLPIPSLKPNEVFAPMYKDGESVVLIRHPHGGIFEIPEVTVNNKNLEARRIISKDATDAIGIHPDIAAKLSGADFDGDTAIVIPNSKGYIKTSPSLKELKNFDPRESYPGYDGMKKMTPRAKQLEMGNVSNLITDMTIKGATDREIVRAVRHSMVVIDAEKHGLNYKQSAIDNGIADLKEIYQGSKKAGASTLISKASSEQRVPHRKDAFKIDPKTGSKVFTETGETYINKLGKLVKRTTSSTRIAEAKSAFDLSSGTKMETVYAKHADALKALANKARLLAIKTPNLKYSPTAKKTFAKEVESLKVKLNLANRNKPKERQAQLLADSVYKAKLKSNPDMDASDKKRLRGQALEEARHRVGAKKQKIEITDKEWHAIQLGAISHNTMAQILQNTDSKSLKQRAIPRTAYKMTNAKVARAKSMSSSGYTPAEIASALGVSATTIVETLN